VQRTRLCCPSVLAKGLFSTDLSCARSSLKFLLEPPCFYGCSDRQISVAKTGHLLDKHNMAGISQSGSLTLRLFLVEDHEITAIGVRKALAANSRIKLIAEARDGEQALKEIPLHQPDLVLMDLSLPRLNGIRVTESLRRSGFKPPIIWFSAYPSVEFIDRARLLDVNGFVNKCSSPEELVQAIEIVAKGGTSFSHNVFCDDSFLNSREPACACLSDREKEVLALATKGHTTKEIADMLNISPRTVDTYREHIFAKLGCRNIADMVRYAVKNGLSH
jgi:DNA-binding NarL/FixJ family response regulator